MYVLLLITASSPPPPGMKNNYKRTHRSLVFILKWTVANFSSTVISEIEVHFFFLLAVPTARGSSQASD